MKDAESVTLYLVYDVRKFSLLSSNPVNFTILGKKNTPHGNSTSQKRNYNNISGGIPGQNLICQHLEFLFR